MPDRPGTLVFCLSVDVDPAYEDEFNAWYSGEHLPAVVACPGILSGRRFAAREVRGDREVARYWAFYEVESKQAMAGDEVARLAEEGFGRFTPHVTNVNRMWMTSIG